ncbi:hypothetical protein HHK36_002249 [Tetracentron sinense]|uniref:BAH domain-containing protein n=1 Tax=Tetracentron sinense TaxID=13715 RepID=A0A834ZV42_TETSI|nr:hypothetical protein HHK36_002249 [Tetracentron sinense]
MSANGHGFVDWAENHVSQERGNRVVHYFLKDSAGDSVLAVVGTERSLRHMIYVVSEEFLQVHGSEKSVNAGFKWRSRREVVDWLTSMVWKQHPQPDCSSMYCLTWFYLLLLFSFYSGVLSVCLVIFMGRFARKLKGHNSDIMWSGVAWTCGKQLRHYPGFCRNGITIAIHSFVFVMAKENNHYLAYLDDMYEDKKGQKKVKVRWFHHNQEVKDVIPLRNSHPREVFITPYAQVISAECVDGPATVLTRGHYDKCLAAFPHGFSAKVHLCFRQFRNNRVKPFDLSKLRGYSNQTILSCLDHNPGSKQTGDEEEEFSQGEYVKQGAKRTRSCRGRQRFVANRSSVRISGRERQIMACEPANQNLKFGLSCQRPLAIKGVQPQPWLPLPLKVDEKIELLCQDSGIRGCWFRCTVLHASRKHLKVQYDDVQNDDGYGNLEESIPAFRLAAPDKLGMRCSGRLTVRPCPPEDSIERDFEVGAPVDAWWSDGWWEGVVTGVGNCGDDSLQVYFPGEDVFSTFQRKNLRGSRDWIGNQWVDIKVKPDILSAISVAVSPGTKLSTSTTIAKAAEFGGSAMLDHEVPTTSKLDTVEEDKEELAGSVRSDVFLECVKWVSSRKRPWIEEDGKRNGDDDYGYDNGHGMDTEDDYDDNGGDAGDNDSNENKLDRKEDFEAAGQNREDVEFMEVETKDA